MVNILCLLVGEVYKRAVYREIYTGQSAMGTAGECILWIIALAALVVCIGLPLVAGYGPRGGKPGGT